MRMILSALTAVLMVGTLAHANELDNEAQVTNETKALSRNLPQTLVVRTNAATGEVQVLHSNDRLPADMTAAAMIANKAFSKADVNAKTPGGELDHDSSQSSWYFCWNRGFGGGWGYPYYWYGGYNFNYNFNYNYYYGYNWGGWNYGYYRWNWGWY